MAWIGWVRDLALDRADADKNKATRFDQVVALILKNSLNPSTWPFWFTLVSFFLYFLWQLSGWLLGVG